MKSESEKINDLIRKPLCAIIEGIIYHPGDGRRGDRFNGMGGRRFDIEYLDGTKVTTYDLWMNGCVPYHLQREFPDNAKFINGAASHIGEDYMAWSNSKNNTEEYPSPRDVRRKEAKK